MSVPDLVHLDVGFAVHPLAQLFPPMSAETYAALVKDIREHGQREPITTFQGATLDGVHRAMACKDLGITPVTQEFAGTETELLNYVLSMNLHRRHLDESQRALVAARIANLSEGRPGKETASNGAVSQTVAASLMKVSRSSVQRAAKIAREAPELVPAVERGELAVSAAAQLARLPRGQQRQVVTDPGPCTRRMGKPKKKDRAIAKRLGRADRWAEAAGRAEAALEELIEVQSEYRDWRDNLPENLTRSPVGEKLEAVCELDLEGALNAVREASGSDLPLGFGRD